MPKSSDLNRIAQEQGGPELINDESEVFTSFPANSDARKIDIMGGIFLALCQWIPKHDAARLAIHEMQHALADKGEGSMHVFAKELEEGRIQAVNASYRPKGDRTDEEFIRIISAPDELSLSDKAQLDLLRGNKKSN